MLVRSGKGEFCYQRNVLFSGEVLVGVTNGARFVALGAFITLQLVLSKGTAVYQGTQLQWHWSELLHLRKAELVTY